ncbi:MAG TPA: PAC2 family protein [Acidimicrobiales bacterium]|nr:PAC2 family protein [Acidimicrobiales bacterium]
MTEGMSLHRRTEAPIPDNPVLVVAMEGWIDAGGAAASAWARLQEWCRPDLLASFDADQLIDFRARRPRLIVRDGQNAGLTWAQPELRGATDANGKGMLFLVGPEPDFRWQAFAADVAALAVELNVRMMVGLGGFPAAVPHTRRVKLASTASSSELAEKVGFIGGMIEVPAGIEAVIERSCAAVGIPSVGLWARVPHYVAAMNYPAAAAALLDGLRDLTGIEVDTSELHEAAYETRGEVDKLIGGNPEHMTLVAGLEASVDEAEGNGFGALPSGDELAVEFERYLRGEDNPPS